MAKFKTDTLRYHTKLTVDEEGIITPQNRYQRISKDYVKKFQNGYCLLFQLDSTTRNLLDWLVDTMSIHNIVENSEFKRTKFIQVAQKVGMKTYQDQTIRKSFQKLTKAGVLLPIRKGLFQVNPELFFKGGEGDRRITLRAIYEKRKNNGLSENDL